MNLRARIAWNLRAIRTKKGITQENLAVDAAIDRSTISEIERQRFNVSIDLVERIAAALDVDPLEFFNSPPSNGERPQGLKPGRKPE
ncbi:helix-turn-helix domain-containing protein [Neorhizobium galegae]|uniref:helix-turn-helix domain-containing protein n=1 Tax=Neorhizobium galegae TaxID=399 RepID=UPI002100E97A|nr:helix-turn-helix transcriptional regulator [Neorhizobium galegae]MCQ1573471.1 helix-turn-helix domain-containing protein [Neorhizobium galegae]